MKYCPECETEYLDKAERCADCGCDLVDEETFRSGAASERGWGGRSPEAMVMACEVGDQVEADQLIDLLEQNRVPVHFHSYEEVVYIGHTDLHQGFGELWVPKEWLHAARALIDEFFCAPPVTDEDQG